MARADKKSSSRLKLGCLGVLLVGGLLLIWTVSLFGTAYLRGQNEVVESRALTRPIPETEAGRVVLDFTVGEFYVLCGEPGEPVGVEAEFDTRSYALRERFDPSPDSGWTYRVTFEETSWFKDAGLRKVLGGSFPKITVSLPPDRPLALEGSFGKGYAEIELGGLWLTEVDIEFEKGALDVGANRPLVAPLERLAIRSRQGGAFIRSLGNASPRTLEIDHRMGGLTVDLGGRWVRDAEIRVASLMGGAQLRLPDGVDVRGLARDRIAAPRQAEIPLPTLTMDVSSRLGDMSIVGPDR